MGRRDPRVDAYIATSADFAQPILTHLRELVHATCPDVEETMKWSFPHFMYRGMLCSMASFKGHCALNFWKGALVLDGAGSCEAMGQFGRIGSLADLPAETVLAGYVQKAMALNERGVKSPVRASVRVARPERPVPPALAAALAKNAKARATFAGFPPSQRREYVDWISDAKTDATRERRVATAVEWLAEGKTRNWKYESKA